GIRADRAREIKMPELCADRFPLGAHGRPSREALFNAGSSRRSSAAPRLNRRAESLAFRCRSRARHVTRGSRSENLLHHAGHSRAAHFRSFHESAEASPFQLSALSRKSVARRVRFHRYAPPFQSTPQKARRAHPYRAPRRRPRTAKTPRAAPPAQTRKTSRQRPAQLRSLF